MAGLRPERRTREECIKSVRDMTVAHNQIEMRFAREQGYGAPQCECGSETKSWWSYCAICGAKLNR